MHSLYLKKLKPFTNIISANLKSIKRVKDHFKYLRALKKFLKRLPLKNFKIKGLVLMFLGKIGKIRRKKIFLINLGKIKFNSFKRKFDFNNTPIKTKGGIINIKS
jgi:hypothetical protein